MRIAVVGAGATGGFFGGCLARAGEEVVFVARGAQLAALRTRGLRVESASAGTFTIERPTATDDPREAGPVDLVLVCVKAWDLDAAALAMRPLVGASTVVVPVLNGIEAPERLAARVGRAHVLGGVARLEAFVPEAGVVRHTSGGLRHLAIGELDGQPSSRLAAAVAALRRGGFDVDVPRSIAEAMWTKFLFICGYAGVGAVTRVPAGILRSLPETRGLLQRAMAEVAAVARAQGVDLGAGVVQAQLAVLDALPEGARASMARDLALGKRIEVDALNGAACRLGAARGVPTPVNEVLYASLAPYRDGTPQTATG